MLTREQLDAKKVREKARRDRLRAKNVDRLCPPDHPHGRTSTCGKAHGCACDDCREYNKRESKAYYRWANQHRDSVVDAGGTMRRLQALMVAGWSQKYVASRLGIDHVTVADIRRGARSGVHRSTRDAVSRLAL